MNTTAMTTRVANTVCNICICSFQYPELEAALALWIHQQEGGLIRTKAEQIAAALSIEELKLREGWLTSFKEQHMLLDQKRHGEAGHLQWT